MKEGIRSSPENYDSRVYFKVKWFGGEEAIGNTTDPPDRLHTLRQQKEVVNSFYFFHFFFLVGLWMTYTADDDSQLCSNIVCFEIVE